jgi:hypothetical protein
MQAVPIATRPAGSRVRLTTKLVVGLASAMIGLLTAEGLARHYDPPLAVVVPQRRETVYGRPDGALGWVPLPNLDRFHMTEVDLQGKPVLDYYVSTNSRGFRGRREYQIPKPAGVRRVVVIGDSYTWGQAVEEDETIPARLEREGVEAPNLGVISYGPGQMLLRLRQDGFSLEPDVVLCCLIGDDVHRDTEPYSINGLQRPVLLQIGESDYLFPEVTALTRAPASRLRAGTCLPGPRGLWRVLADTELELGVGPRWRLFGATVATMARLTRQHGARFAVAVLDEQGLPLLRVTRALGARLNFDVVDCTRPEDWSPHRILDGHPNAVGYGLIVRNLLAAAPWTVKP